MSEAAISFVVSWLVILIPLMGIAFALIFQPRVSILIVMMCFWSLLISISLASIPGDPSVVLGAVAFLVTFIIKYLYQRFKQIVS